MGICSSSVQPMDAASVAKRAMDRSEAREREQRAAAAGPEAVEAAWQQYEDARGHQYWKNTITEETEYGWPARPLQEARAAAEAANAAESAAAEQRAEEERATSEAREMKALESAGAESAGAEGSQEEGGGEGETPPAGATIVIDNGGGFLKAGVGGYDAPNVMFPCLVGRPSGSGSSGYPKDLYVGEEARSAQEGALTLTRPIVHGMITNWDDMEKIWHHAFYNELKIKKGEHAVLLTEPPVNPKANRERMTQIMFENFNVPTLQILNHCVLAISATGGYTGVAVDAGFDVTNIAPVYEGYALPHACVGIELAGHDLTMFMASMLKEQAGLDCGAAQAERIARDVKEKHAFVALDYDAELSTLAAGGSDAVYEISGDGTRLTILGSQRCKCPEALFQPEIVGKDVQSLHMGTYMAVMQCDVDCRTELFANVVCTGGTSMIQGFVERMSKELNSLSDKKVTIFENAAVKDAAWLGGSLTSGLSAEVLAPMQLTAEVYGEQGPAAINGKM